MIRAPFKLKVNNISLSRCLAHSGKQTPLLTYEKNQNIHTHLKKQDSRHLPYIKGRTHKESCDKVKNVGCEGGQKVRFSLQTARGEAASLVTLLIKHPEGTRGSRWMNRVLNSSPTALQSVGVLSRDNFTSPSLCQSPELTIAALAK